MEIKFKFINKKTGEIKYFTLVQLICGGGTFLFNNGIYHICQYVGLKDKNKIDAYNGDKAKYKDQSGKEQIGVITYECCNYVLIADGGDDEGNQNIDLHPDEEFEIIGNVYDKNNKSL